MDSTNCRNSSTFDGPSSLEPRPGGVVGGPSDLDSDRWTLEVTVNNPQGLHMRTGGDVVRVASQYEAEIVARNLSRQSGRVDVKSILQLMQLQARKGHTLLLCANGPDAREALEAVASLL